MSDEEDDKMKDLLKRSLGAPGDEPSSLLPAVQRKLRERSKGKFYSDGWSTSQSRVNYAMIALVMLLVIAVCYFALGPTGVTSH